MDRLFKFLPVTPSLRFTRKLCKKHLTKIKSVLKTKTFGLCKNAGRNNKGRLTIFTQGGGHKRKYRQILKDRSLLNGIVESIEYDPNRTGDIARIYSWSTKTHYYILAPQKLKRGNIINSVLNDSQLSLRIGNTYRLKDLPLGVSIYDLPFPYSKNRAVLSAGCKAVILSKSSLFCRIKLNSGELRLYPTDTLVCLGAVSNPLHQLISLGKAGRSRWLGRRPSVRGVAMNPVDHPHGGGEGKTSGGRPSVTPWGKVARGQPTRKKKKNKYML
jgi:large subunit ribosomal protein L2